MPEQINDGGAGTPGAGQGSPAGNTNNNPTGTDPKTTDTGSMQNFDPSKLSDEDFGKFFSDKRAFTHSRFKDLLDKAKKADEYEAAKSVEEEERLKQQKKYEELYNKKGEEAADWKGRYESSVVNNQVFLEAQKLGAVDLDVVTKLIDRASIKVTKDGVEGVAEAVAQLKTDKPYLFGGSATQPSGFGNGSNPITVNTGVKFKLSQIQDAKFYREHEAQILEAYKSGNIENDLPGQS